MKQKWSIRLKRYVPLLCASLAWGFCVLFYLSICLKKQTIWVAVGTAVVLFAGGIRLPRIFTRALLVSGGAGLVGAAAVLLLVTMGGGQYEPVEGSYQQSVYAAPKKVMVIVPHEDDDLNLAGGVIDSYRDAGTQVKVVFFSNGDYRFKNAYRFREALQCQELLGVPKEDVIFMGYGDTYKTPYGHLYNAPSDEVVTSHAGYTSTYGLKTHPDYRTSVSGSPSDYTRANAVKDMQDLLASERPDVIYCVDQDSHADHRAAGLIFEEALGNLLRLKGDYHPSVYKGFAYSDAWSTREDYHNLNAPSTKIRYKKGRMEETNCYLWADRVRLPVKAQDLSYTCRSSGLWQAFAAYDSQRAIRHIGKVVNSDKVFWSRRTDSLLYDAGFSAENSSGLSMLHDFKLADSDHIAKRKHRPFDGTWAAGEGEVLTVKLSAPSVLKEVVLYDNPSLEDDILQARVALDSGEALLTGALEPGGAPTRVEFHGTSMVSSFTVKILKTEGEQAGLCELEAYEAEEEMPAYIKLTDAKENFLYTYTPADKKTIKLKLYGSTPELKAMAENPGEGFTAEADGVSLVCEGDTFLLPCPEKKITVRVQMKTDASVYDEIVVKPYSSLRVFGVKPLYALDSLICAFSNYTRWHLSHLENEILKISGVL